MTIHSFCLSVARENYNRLGIDPAFRVADETEKMCIRDRIYDADAGGRTLSYDKR